MKDPLTIPKDLITEISPLDTMCDKDKEHAYFSVGYRALANCKWILRDQVPSRIIDFPSGYGRALRWFRHEWPHAEIYAVETDSRMLDFVTEKFDALRIQADPHLNNMELPGDTDLIFTGSLLTHFDEPQWDRFLKMSIAALRTGGRLVFTIHGRLNALRLKDNPVVYGDMVDGWELYKSYLDKGFAYQPYHPDYPEFGVSLSSPAWVFKKLQKIPFGKIIFFEETAWGQDVIGIEKINWSLV
jgi:SAM-dependent methyltransferase